MSGTIELDPIVAGMAREAGAFGHARHISLVAHEIGRLIQNQTCLGGQPDVRTRTEADDRQPSSGFLAHGRRP